ncbi:hypothetical protein BM1_05366 [Bipolaris maydis]|nr:hypothetical protein BM1_05366 [Bipolaris maydis]
MSTRLRHADCIAQHIEMEDADAAATTFKSQPAVVVAKEAATSIPLSAVSYPVTSIIAGLLGRTAVAGSLLQPSTACSRFVSQSTISTRRRLPCKRPDRL